MVTFNTHTKIQLPNEAHVIGDGGTMSLLLPFWSANKLKTPKELFEYTLPEGEAEPSVEYKIYFF